MLDTRPCLGRAASVPRLRTWATIQSRRTGVDHAAGAKDQLCVPHTLGCGQSCWAGRAQ